MLHQKKMLVALLLEGGHEVDEMRFCLAFFFFGGGGGTLWKLMG